ncbi:hypothetical protein AJ79_10363 [Helicocarpus griseus UAMH5409]|uniref:Uncharacterized protein n=1 Tax=Helicocarpus griseus UAMH5409 TaxID=1447875 RepID=A0A2B7WE95_9EURO|nr:hypothetical protein AJ79_10363 [Helicocarpus griseus UAMH5409]
MKDWHEYDADDTLKTMRLHLPSQLKVLIDTIRIYADLRGPFQKGLAATVKKFFTLMIMNSNATVKTNPLL